MLKVDWQALNGSSVKRRILKLKCNEGGIYSCPVTSCLHVGFKSDRGLRKHIQSTHPWYYYFDEQPFINRDTVAKKDDEKHKITTHNIPAFSLLEGLGAEFLSWLSQPCGGGKSVKQGVQIGRRAMKFLMASIGASEVDKHLNEDYVDCSLGSPPIIINFLKTITEVWRISSSGALNYMNAINDLQDFRKASGVTDDVLRAFTVTEVYIRRGKENLAKKKKMEYSRNLDLERLIAKDSWATVEEMEKVIPYHSSKYQHVLKQCATKDCQPTISDLAFATRFIATFLFLRVKCSRPMTFQFITMHMLHAAKTNGGFIDQTSFKTEDSYAFDTLILSSDVIDILDSYADIVRPRLNPSCNYLVLTTNGTQYTAFGTAMSLLVHQAIGKHVNPTRYRMIIETESADRLTPPEVEALSKDQKHSSYIAKRVYQKKLSRDVAEQGKNCMNKIVGEARDIHTRQFASDLCAVIKDQRSDESVQSLIPSPQSAVSTAVIETEKATYVVDDDTCQVIKSCVQKNGTITRLDDNPGTSRSLSTSLLSPSKGPQEIGDNILTKNITIVSTGEEIEHGVPSAMDYETTLSEAYKKVTGNAAIAELVYAGEEETSPVGEAIGDNNDINNDKSCESSSSTAHCTVPTAPGNIPKRTAGMDVEVKKEEAEKEVQRAGKLMRFTPEEDTYLKKGIEIYGVSRWSRILHDKSLIFHPARTRDTLRVRAATIGLVKKKNSGRKSSTVQK